jgi:hypothetical protein
MQRVLVDGPLVVHLAHSGDPSGLGSGVVADLRMIQSSSASPAKVGNLTGQGLMSSILFGSVGLGGTRASLGALLVQCLRGGDDDDDPISSNGHRGSVRIA